MRPGGVGGAVDQRPSNLLVKWKEGLDSYAQAIVGLPAVVALPPWLGAIALLGLASRLWMRSQVPISERQASIVYALYDRGKMHELDAVPTERLVGLVNAITAPYHRQPITREELLADLRALRSLRAVRATPTDDDRDGAWWLEDRVNVTLD